MTQFYLAVDGGGSSTEFTLAHGSFERVFSFTAGPTSFKSVGMEAAQANLADGAARLRDELAKHDIALEDVCGTWGMSGCDSERDAQTFRAMLSMCGIDLARHVVCNDALLALRAVTVDAGVVVVAGTGSVCIGVDDQGAEHRIGGWGYQFSDLGSGCWMGSELIREALLFRDGCRAHDPAFDRALPLLDDAASLTRADEIARFARIVLACDDSPACQAIREKAADYLAGYAVSMAHALETRASHAPRENASEPQISDASTATCTAKTQAEYETSEEPLPIVLAGGLFKHDTFFRAVAERITQHVPPTRVAIRRASADSPACGGISMTCARRSGETPDASRIFPVISVDLMRESDAHTIATLVDDEELMDRAGRGIARLCLQLRNITPQGTFAVVCGPGNNGGDGYVAARYLAEQGCDVTVFFTKEPSSASSLHHRQLLETTNAKVSPFHRGEGESSAPNLDAFDCIIDCLLGTGFSGAPRGVVAEAIRAINEAGMQGAAVVSADINSGVNGDTGEGELAVKSDLTVSIGYLKAGMIKPAMGTWAQRIANLDIGIELAAPPELTLRANALPAWIDRALHFA